MREPMSPDAPETPGRCGAAGVGVGHFGTLREEGVCPGGVLGLRMVPVMVVVAHLWSSVALGASLHVANLGTAVVRDVLACGVTASAIPHPPPPSPHHTLLHTCT